MSFIQLQELKSREVIPGFTGRFVHSENMTVAFWTVKAGAVAPVHTHPHEQVFMAMEGTFELTIDGQSREYRPGSVAVIPSNVPHSARAVTDCQVIDIFHPVREDLR